MTIDATTAKLGEGMSLATIQSISLDLITTAPQVRTKFNNANLLELGEDIKKRGLLQPIVVTPEGNGYRLIIGERRLRAMKLAGCELAPAIIAPAQTDGDLMETQLIENIQSEDLNNKDLIDGVKALFDKYGKSVKAVAGILNKSNTWVSKKVAIALQAGPLTMRLIEAEIKDGELLYAFAKLETIDTAVALDLVDGIVGRTIGRKDVQAALKAAAAGGVEAEEDRDDTTNELFPETSLKPQEIASMALKAIEAMGTEKRSPAAMLSFAIEELKRVSQAK